MGRKVGSIEKKVEKRYEEIMKSLDLQAVPERERWAYENPEVLKSILRGLEQAKAGQFSSVNWDEK